MPERRFVRTEGAPEPIGPYSQAVLVGNTVWCSGQIGIDPRTGLLVSGGAAAQMERALMNLSAVLEEAGAGLHSVVKTTIYLKSMADFPSVNDVYAKSFRASRPARSTVEVSALPKGALVEIEAIAVI